MGSAAVTPGRLLVHERALVGAQVRVAQLIGSYRREGTFVAPPPRTSEVDLEQAVFGAVQIGARAQVAVLIPLIETHRATPGAREWGGGLGDVAASGRYDLTRAGESLTWPGLAVLAGVTIPTGVPIDRADNALATDATGIGAWQGSLGVAVEQTFGPWFAGITALAAERLPRRVGGIDARLGTRWTLLGTGALAITDQAAVALSLSYQHEGNATLNGVTESGSRQRLWTVGCSSSWSVSDTLRLHGGLAVTPPWSGFGANLPSTASLVAGLVRTW